MEQGEENIALYESQIKKGDADPYPYDRLMIYYRKQKEYMEELRVINRGLKVFTDKLKRQQAEVLKGFGLSSSAKKLSKKIGMSVGLLDKKGSPSYLPDPLARWTRRKKTAEQKLAKKTSSRNKSR